MVTKDSTCLLVVQQNFVTSRLGRASYFSVNNILLLILSLIILVSSPSSNFYRFSSYGPQDWVDYDDLAMLISMLKDWIR